MEFKEILKGSWTEFSGNFSPLLLATGPYIAATIILGTISETAFDSDDVLLPFVGSCIVLVLQALIAMSGLKYLYGLRGVDLVISSDKVAVFIFASLYISLATTIGLAFFIIPGIIIMAVSFLMPIYILKEGQGPIEAVSSSASLMKDCYVQVTLFLSGIWIGITAIDFSAEFTLGILSLPVVLAHGLANGLSLIIGLFLLPVMITLYSNRVTEESTTN